MSIYKKLNEARLALQGSTIKKSGENKFAGYKYFELGDFLPTINKIFNDNGLCGVVSFGIDLATLTITDIDDNSQILITSPMAEANLKGCHPIQNLGAVETYTRRYLWVTAMEIVEHDQLDSSAGVEVKTIKPLEFYIDKIRAADTVAELNKIYKSIEPEIKDNPKYKSAVIAAATEMKSIMGGV